MSDLSAFGITATLPSGWDGRIFRRPADPPPSAASLDTAGTSDIAAVVPAPDGTVAGGVQRSAAEPVPLGESGTAAPGTVPGTTVPAVPGATPLDSGTVHPVAHVASFPLPAVRGDYGSGAVERMLAQDIFVSLVEFDPEAAGTALFSRVGVPRFAIGDFAPHTMQRTITGMCGAQAFFVESGRAFSAYVVLGSFRGRAPLVPPVNRLMASVRIA
jgi:hypothetical protein